VSAGARPSIQARGRCRLTIPAGSGKPEHEYVRHGTLALLAALDVHTGKVFASTPATIGIAPFMDLMGQVMSLPEYKDAPRVFVILDNGSAARPPSPASAPRAFWLASGMPMSGTMVTSGSGHERLDHRKRDLVSALLPSNVLAIIGNSSCRSPGQALIPLRLLLGALDSPRRSDLDHGLPQCVSL
jgi:hypothetical protein